MINLKTALPVVLIFLNFMLHGQEVSEGPVKNVRVNDIYLQASFYFVENTYRTPDVFSALAPGSTLLKSDFTGFSETNESIVLPHKMFSALAGIDFANKEKTDYRSSPQLRLGISYFSGGLLSSGMNRRDYIVYDTITSSRTGKSFTTDSVIYRSFSMRYKTDQLRLDASLIFKTRPWALFSLFAGFGFTSGFSVQNMTTISYFERGSLEDSWLYSRYFDGAPTFSSFDYYREEETFSNQPNISFSAYFPMGINLRPGSKEGIFKNVRIFYEFRPGLFLTSVPETGTIKRRALQHGIGLRTAI